MTRAPRTARGYGSLAGEMRLHVPHRFMPIIVVPGIMGSRLSDPKNGKLAWNPKGIPFGAGPRAFKVDYKRLEQAIPLVADERNNFKDRAQRNAVKKIRHYTNIVGEFYGDLAKGLADMSGGSFEEFGVKPRVYCCGYDWRQDNARSALRLAEVVEEALADTREDRCIIVAHSMGGMVARYYCHALGGEKRVHALILLGSPTLGAPTAYVQLKAGMHGSYPQELGAAIDQGDAGAIVEQTTHQVANVVGGVAGAVTRGDVMELFDVIYIALCMGAGRWLSRAETRYFARQLPSMYELMPNRTYCHSNNHWVLFDPMATGHPPTGAMFVLPTLLDSVVGGVAAVMGAIDANAAREGEKLKASYNKAMKPGAALRTSERAHRNVMTLEKFAEEIAEAYDKFREKDEPFHLHKIYKLIKELWERADESILHTGPHEHFYRDIFTGLLDIVEQRALCAGNLELALRFDETLTTGDGGGHAGGHGLMKAMISPLLGALGLRGGEGGSGHGGGEHGGGGESGPKVYMHPHTINIYCATEQVEAGCALLPTEILSNDDSNEVHYRMLPFPIGMPGDGTVPAASANPPESQLSHAFELSEAFAGVGHSALPSTGNVIDFIKRRLDAMVETFVLGRDHVPRQRREQREAHEEAAQPAQTPQQQQQQQQQQRQSGGDRRSSGDVAREQRTEGSEMTGQDPAAAPNPPAQSSEAARGQQQGSGPTDPSELQSRDPSELQSHQPDPDPSELQSRDPSELQSHQPDHDPSELQSRDPEQLQSHEPAPEELQSREPE